MKKISICIPSYKRPENIQRLLESIAVQTFKDYEIIITDDSPDESVKHMVDKFLHLPITYFKNQKALGTPANWNYAISLAKGEWIKLMHDDDWFRSKDSLRKFVNKTNEQKNFIFSGFVTIFESNKEQESRFPFLWKQRIVRHPVSLLAQNVIGTPSVTLVRRELNEFYDERMKWRVDIDYYIRLLKKEKAFALVNEPLVNVGMSAGQVTSYSINRPEVELPEGLLLLEKYGVTPLKKILVYDAWWRVLRNTKTRSTHQLYQFGSKDRWPVVVIKMVNQQSKIPPKMLMLGPISKSMMLLSYLANRRYLHD